MGERSVAYLFCRRSVQHVMRHMLAKYMWGHRSEVQDLSHAASARRQQGKPVAKHTSLNLRHRRPRLHQCLSSTSNLILTTRHRPPSIQFAHFPPSKRPTTTPINRLPARFLMLTALHPYRICRAKGSSQHGISEHYISSRSSFVRTSTESKPRPCCTVTHHPRTKQRPKPHPSLTPNLLNQPPPPLPSPLPHNNLLNRRLKNQRLRPHTP